MSTALREPKTPRHNAPKLKEPIHSPDTSAAISDISSSIANATPIKKAALKQHIKSTADLFKLSQDATPSTPASGSQISSADEENIALEEHTTQDDVPVALEHDHEDITSSSSKETPEAAPRKQKKPSILSQIKKSFGHEIQRFFTTKKKTDAEEQLPYGITLKKLSQQQGEVSVTLNNMSFFSNGEAGKVTIKGGFEINITLYKK